MPIPKNEEEMEGHGWKKELTIKHIEIVRGQILCQEYDFFADRMPCKTRESGLSGPQCGTDHVWITCIHGRLFWCCFRHRVANGPISFEVGSKAKQYSVQAEEAVKICNETGQAILPELKNAYDLERAEKFGKRRRPNK